MRRPGRAAPGRRSGSPRGLRRGPAGERRRGPARTRRAGLLFGAFALAALVLLGALAQRVGSLTFFNHQVTERAAMTDATGLAASDPVKIAGVTVGQVTGVGVDHGHAVVTFTLNRGVRIRTSTQTGLRAQNVLGQEFLYLYPGTTGPLLAAGASLPLDQSLGNAGVGALLNALGPFLTAVNPKEANTLLQSLVAALQGNESEVGSLIDNAATVSTTVGSIDAQVGAVIGNLDQVLTALANRSTDLGTLLDNLQTVSQALAGRNSLLDSVVTNLSHVTGEFAGLAQANQGTLRTAIDALDSVTGAVQQNEQQLSSGLTTLGTGLAPYTEVSSYGQFFAIQTIYLCLAGETVCTYNDPSSPPAGALPGGVVPPLPLASPAGGAGSRSGVGSSGSPGAAAPGAAPAGTAGSVLQMVAGIPATAAPSGSGS